LKSEASLSKDFLMEYLPSPPTFSIPTVNRSVRTDHHHVFRPGRVGMFSLPLFPLLYVAEITKPTKNTLLPTSKPSTESIKSIQSCADITIPEP
jgi:hypothetical protein